jgi:putative PEP-CTERM system TPR-repeat lipoprotein
MAVQTRSKNAALLFTLLLSVGISACSRTETTETLLADAKQYQQKGDTKAALIQLKNAVAKSPEDGEARMLLATLYSETGDYVSAEKEVRKAMGLGIPAERTLPLLGKSLVALRKFQNVLDEIPAAAAAKSAKLSSLRGNAFLALNDAPNAKAAYDQALALAGDAGGALIGLTMYSLAQKNDDAASRYSADSLVKDPTNPDVWMVNAMLLRKHGKPLEARNAYEQAIKLRPGHHGAYLEKAYIEIGQANFAAAQADLTAARKLAPGNLMIAYVQALLDSRQGKLAPALESVTKVLAAAPDHMPSLLLAGQLELQTGANQQAQNHLRKYLEATPQDVQARKLLAHAMLKGAQPADALALLAPLTKEASLDPQLMALAGQSHMQNKDYGKAAEYFEKASALEPRSADLRTSLGLSKLAQGNQAGAVSELEAAASLDPKSARAGVTLVQTEMALKHYDKAMAAALALEKAHPQDPQIHNLKGGVLAAMGDVAGARASFEKAVALQPGFFPAVANLARLDMQDRKPDAAQKRFEAVLEKDKKNVPAMMALAEIAGVRNQPEQVAIWLEKALAEKPDAVDPALKLAEHYARNKQEQKALTLMSKVQTSNPANPAVLDMLGQIQLANKDQNGALETYSKLASLTPKSPAVHMRLASVHMLMKNEPAAVQDLKRAIAADPSYLPARIGAAELAVRRGKPDEAMAMAREVQRLDPKSAAGFMMEGELQLGQRKPALALVSFEKAFSLAKSAQLLVKIAEMMKLTGKDPVARLQQWHAANPSDVVVSAYLAETSLFNKQYKQAAEQFEALLKIAPNSPVALNNLAWTYQKIGDPRALQMAERALAAAPESPAIIDTLGWMLVEQGNVARGLPLLKKAVGLAPAAAEFRYHLAVALNKSGDKANAKLELSKLLSDNKPFAQMEEAKALLKVL